MVGGERQRGDLLLGRHRLARAGHAGNKTVAVEQISAVADDEVMRYGVDAVVNTARVLDLLRFERHKNSGTLRGQGAGSVNALEAEGQYRVQGVLLLVAQNVKLTAPRPPDGL